MPATPHLRIEEVIEAFTELGGEAEWTDVERRVTERRGQSYAPYKDWRNFKNTMFQFVQQHCEGYRKFTGPIIFAKAGTNRFRLVQSQSSASRVRIPPEKIYPEELPNRHYITGAVHQILVNSYERDPHARQACLDRYGTTCAVCRMNFEERYGPIGRGFIHVHHKKPLALREVYFLDPINDLVPVCPNCHSMLHTYDPPLSVEELESEMKRANSGMQ